MTDQTPPVQSQSKQGEGGGCFLRFDYINHRGEEHEYLVRPIEVSRPDARWCLEADVIERDGNARPGRRTFALAGLRNVQDRILRGDQAGGETRVSEHAHKFERFHADYCHRYEWGYICECGETRHVDSQTRNFRNPDSAWWHWGRAGCDECEGLMRQAGLDLRALADENLACIEIDRQFAKLGEGRA